jgi:hypothetical protein
MTAIIAFLAVAAANFVFIGLKAFQQRNVIHDNYALVVLTSNAMAFFEVYVVATIAKHGMDLWLVFALGLGGGTGCLAAMLLHKRFVLRRGSIR